MGTNIRNILRGMAFFFFLAILALGPLIIIITCALLSVRRSPGNPIDPTQFSTNRQIMAEGIPDEWITPAQVSEFVLQEVYDNVHFAGNPERHVFAEYRTTDGQAVRIAALLFAENSSLEPLLTRGINCGDCMGSAQVYKDADVPYGYAFCGCFGFGQHTFNWMNGRWALSAEAASTDGNTLIEFVNSCPY